MSQKRSAALSSNNAASSSSEVVNQGSFSGTIAPIYPQMGAVPGSQNTLPLATPSLSDLSDDVSKFFREYQFDMENLSLFSDIHLEKLCKYNESDESKAIIPLNRLQRLRKIPSSLPNSYPDANGTLTSTKLSNFGSALFPSGGTRMHQMP
jgi:hypothetical protein